MNLSKPPRTLAERDEELYRYLCRLVDDINANEARRSEGDNNYTEEDI